MLVLPVDMPLIRPDTIRAALDGFGATEEPVLRATYRGRHGHPVIFGADVFPALRTADPATGARAVLHHDPSRVRNLEVEAVRYARDIDWPAEYRGLFRPGYDLRPHDFAGFKIGRVFRRR